MIKLKIDSQTDALYLTWDSFSKVIESEEISPGIVADFNKKHQVVGIEVLNLSRCTSKLDLRRLEFQTV